MQRTTSATKTLTVEKKIKGKDIIIDFKIGIITHTHSNGAFIRAEIIPKKITIKEKGKERIEEDLTQTGLTSSTS